MVDTKSRQAETRSTRRLRGPAAAAAVFAAIIVLVGVIYAGVALTGGSGGDSAPAIGSESSIADPAPSTIAPGEHAEALVGRSTDVVGGVAVSVPDQIDFNEDGTYTVWDSGRIVDSGIYQAGGDVITFVNDPTDEVRWTVNEVFLSSPEPCEGLVGEYEVATAESGQLVLDVVWDECRERVTVANGLELALRSN